MNKRKSELYKDMNYLNLQEIKKICEKYSIPYKIHVEIKKNKIIKTSYIDRKAIILKRIKSFINTRIIQQPTVFPNSVVSKTNQLPLPLQSFHPALYGEYKNANKKILMLMKELTDNKFEFGAIAQEVLRSCWTQGKPPTYKRFANLWLKALKSHKKPNPEWAYLTDKSKGFSGKDWKKLRLKRSRNAINLLNLLFIIN